MIYVLFTLKMFESTCRLSITIFFLGGGPKMNLKGKSNSIFSYSSKITFYLIKAYGILTSQTNAYFVIIMWFIIIIFVVTK